MRSRHDGLRRGGVIVGALVGCGLVVAGCSRGAPPPPRGTLALEQARTGQAPAGPLLGAPQLARPDVSRLAGLNVPRPQPAERPDSTALDGRHLEALIQSPKPVAEVVPLRAAALSQPRRVTPPRVTPGLPASRIPRGGGYAKVGKPYKIGTRTYYPRRDPSYNRVGIASWYGTAFHGKKTANGERFDMGRLSAAHPTLPLPSLVEVTNLANGRRLIVRVNDRGPYAHGRIIDLSRAVARHLNFQHLGTTKVRVRYVGPAPLDGSDAREVSYLKRQPWYRSQRAQR
ncbi:MAG: septal ring lytic transglycosylase RlpA family protein [Pseudomonadota bacterium]